MIINVAGGVGTGLTTVGAFDAAIYEAGIANRNLIGLSSVVPEGAVVTPIDRHDAPGKWGDRLYVVLAQQYAARFDEEAWAGIGWGFDGSRGLFVHAEGISLDEVKSDIEDSLDALAHTRDITLDKRNDVITGAVCRGDMTCAVVAAVFDADGWG